MKLLRLLGPCQVLMDLQSHHTKFTSNKVDLIHSPWNRLIVMELNKQLLIMSTVILISALLQHHPLTSMVVNQSMLRLYLLMHMVRLNNPLKETVRSIVEFQMLQ